MKQELASRRFLSPLVVGISLLTAAGCATTPESMGPFLMDQSQSIEMQDGISDRVGQGDYVNAVDGSAYRVYEVELDGDEMVAFTATSGELAPRLSVYGPDGTLIGASAAHQLTPHDHGYHGHHGSPRATVVFEPHRRGSYLVVISSGESGQFGAFELTMGTIDEPGTLRPGESTDYYFQDGIAQNRGVIRPVIAHRLVVDEEAIVTVGLQSREFDAYLYVAEAATGQVLAENDDWGGTSDSQVIVELAPGEYEIWASSFSLPAAGSYSISVDEMRFEISREFHPGQPFDGFLGAQREPIPGSNRTGIPLDFSIAQSTTVDIVMHSEDLDSYLVLADGRGNYITEDDDGGGGLNARVRRELAAGDYTLWATSHGEHEMGRFQIESALGGDQVVVEGGMGPGVGGMLGGVGVGGQYIEAIDSLGLGESLTGQLTTDLPVTGPRQTFVVYYELESVADAVVQIDLTSRDFDTYLVLENQAGQVLMENDDLAQDNTDSRITIELEAGTYRLGVTSFAPGEVGEFELQVEELVLTNQQVL